MQALPTDSLKVDYNPFLKKMSLKAVPFCDACSSSSNAGSMGVGSLVSQNFIGIRYFNQYYKSTDGLYSDSKWYNESYNTMQIWGAFPIVKNTQVIAQIPYQFHEKQTEFGNLKIQGLGDVNLTILYQLFKTKNDSLNFKHQFKVGAGIKMPTGKFERENTNAINPSFQLGTGSWDYSGLMEYVLKYKKMGLNAMYNFIYKTENVNAYRFGNQSNYNVSLFYQYKDQDLVLLPQLGVIGEKFNDNTKYQQVIRFTAGDVMFGKVGFEVGLKKWSLGANFMWPLHQNLASNRIEAIYRTSLNINYSL